MATSGNTAWELTRDQIIERALRILGVLAQGASANSDQLSTGASALNGIVSRFNAIGMPLWKRTEAIITLVNATQSYSIAAALKLPEVYIRVINSSVTWKLEWKSQYDFLQLPYTTTGTPVAYSFTPTLAEGGTLRVWPIPDATAATNYDLRVIYQKEFDVFTAGSETLDLPAYWTDAVVFELAAVLAHEYSLPINDRQLLMGRAKDMLEQAKGYSDEDGSIYLQPYYRPDRA